jgi:hypothetical protein
MTRPRLYPAAFPRSALRSTAIGAASENYRDPQGGRHFVGTRHAGDCQKYWPIVDLLDLAGDVGVDDEPRAYSLAVSHGAAAATETGLTLGGDAPCGRGGTRSNDSCARFEGVLAYKRGHK